MSYGLPHTTEVNRALPKKAIYTKFVMKTAVRDRFDADISRLVISHEISPQSVPALSAGEISTIYVLSVLLKRRDFDKKNIEQLTKLIPQHMVIALQFEHETMLAIFNDRLFFADWQPTDAVIIPLDGLSLDTVWLSLVTTIGDITIDEGNTLSEQIVVNEQQIKLRKQIDFLENKLRNERQFTEQRRLYSEIKRLKKQLT